MEEKNLNKCIHNPNDSHHTLIGLNVVKMVYPQKYEFICKNCGEKFVFYREKDLYIKKEGE